MLYGFGIALVAICFLAYKEYKWEKRWERLERRYMNIIDDLIVRQTTDNSYDRQYFKKLMMAANVDTPVAMDKNISDTALEAIVGERKEADESMPAFLNQSNSSRTQRIMPSVGR